jgi:hypothetical protein
VPQIAAVHCSGGLPSMCWPTVPERQKMPCGFLRPRISFQFGAVVNVGLAVVELRCREMLCYDRVRLTCLPAIRATRRLSEARNSGNFSTRARRKIVAIAESRYRGASTARAV